MSLIDKGWLRYSNSNTVIVFIHGFYSSNRQCWYNKKKKIYWPNLILNDVRFNGVDIFLASFYTSIDSNDYKLQNCSDEVWSEITQTDCQMREPVINKKNIIFIGHSTGGIVARYILESKSDEFIKNRIGLLLYASPSYGSKLASKLGWIASKFNNQLAQELQWGSSILDDLDGRFRDLLESRKLDISGLECYENKSPFHFKILNHSNSRIVEKESAGRYFGRPKLVPNTDHSSIVKPHSIDCHSHILLWGFIEKNKFYGSTCNQVITEYYHYDKDVLFDVYSPIQEEFYLNRHIDNTIKSKFDSQGLWVCGPSGVGKTAIIQRALYQKGTIFKYISLGTCIHGNLNEMFMSLAYDLDEETNINESDKLFRILNNISDIILKKCKLNNFVLFIEEVPISNSDDFKEFSKCIYAILIRIKNCKNFKLVLSSIFEPESIHGTEFEKISEGFSILNLGYWTDEELNSLKNIIEKDLGINDYNKIDIFSGNPRKLKCYYRDNYSKLGSQ